MDKHPGLPGVEEQRVLLVNLNSTEREALAHHQVALGSPLQLLALDSAFDALQEIQARPVNAILCGFDSYLDLNQGLLAHSGGATVPVLVLVPPGAEFSAGAVFEQDDTDVLLRQGDYLPLLFAWLRRALHRKPTPWQEVGRIVRHEINNPLTGVLGNAELILADSSPLSPSARNRLRTIVDLAVRMRDVVRHLEERLRPAAPSPDRPPPQTPVEPPPALRESTR